MIRAASLLRGKERGNESVNIMMPSPKKMQGIKATRWLRRALKNNRWIRMRMPGHRSLRQELRPALRRTPPASKAKISIWEMVGRTWQTFRATKLCGHQIRFMAVIGFLKSTIMNLVGHKRSIKRGFPANVPLLVLRRIQRRSFIKYDCAARPVHSVVAVVLWTSRSQWATFFYGTFLDLQAFVSDLLSACIVIRSCGTMSRIIIIEKTLYW